MTYVIVGALVLMVFYGAAARRAAARSPVKISAAVFAVLCLAAAGFVGLRGSETEAIGLALAGAMFTAWARWPRRTKSPQVSEMSLAEARATLGVSADATAAEIKIAYLRLIQRVHPDQGGAEGLAAHLNAARDKLLKS